MLGCDTTSKLYGTGKGTALKQYVKDKTFRESASVFGKGSDEVSKEELVQAGERAILSLYKHVDREKSLDEARAQIFTDNVAKGPSTHLRCSEVPYL